MIDHDDRIKLKVGDTLNIKETNLDPKRGPVCKDPNFGASLYPPYPVDPWDMPGDRG